jgi:hypothetical protein
VTIQPVLRIKRKRRAQQAQRIQVLKELFPSEALSQETELGKNEFILAYVRKQD